jgi:uncharacterized protein
MSLKCCVLFLVFAFSSPVASAQPFGASLDQLAATPLVKVHVSEQLRAPPDEATLRAGTEARAPSAVAALTANKQNTEKLLSAVRAAGIGPKDVQTEGVSVSADYNFETVNGRAMRRFNGYIARNSVRIKTRDIGRLTTLLDALTRAGATEISGPEFGIADPAPLRSEARRRAMARGEAEATEYARNASFARVRLLSVEEGVSYRATDIVLTGRRMEAPPPPQPVQAVSSPSIEPGQIETGVTLTLVYRMER